jgi:thiosulfate/3-mercaptopyruvate sulfurtransferase
VKNTIVSAEWLLENIENKNLVIIDASPVSNVSGLEPKNKGVQIKGAAHLNLKQDFSKADADFPNTLLSPEAFETKAQNLGVNGNSQIVVYDNLGVYTAPRVWWMFRAMGHNEIAVLNGGLDAWIEAGGETEEIGDKETAQGDFKAHFNKEMWRGASDMVKNISSQTEVVIDARSRGRFLGTIEEPRKGLSSGHIPNSVNLPFKEVLHEGKYKSSEELKELFAQLPLQEEPIVFSCGSGLTACINMLAAEQVLDNQKAVYDGSWTEWATINDQLIEKV